MSNLSEDEIIDRVMMIDQWKTSGDIYTQDELNAIGQFIDLYNKQQEIIKSQSYTNKKLRNKIKTVRKERNKLKKELNLKDKIINKMSEQLTTPIHSKEWVIKYYEEQIKK